MRFVIVGPAYPFRGGISHFAGSLHREFIAQGNESKLVTFQKQYPRLFFPGKNQFETDSTFSDCAGERVLIPYDPFTYHKTLQRIVSSQPDIVIFSYFIPYFAISYLYLIKRLNKLKIKTVLLAHNIDFHEKWFMGDKLSRKLLHLSSKVLTLSENVYQDAVKMIGQSEKLIKGFHPVYDFFKPEVNDTVRKSNCKVILFFGYIKPYKGLDILIKSFSLIKKDIPEATLLIVGEIYGDKKYYYDLIDNSPHKIDIKLVNKYIDSNEVTRYFMQSDVVALPYRQATQSGVIQTAYSMGKGVVVTPIGGLPEMVTQDVTGVIASSISEKDFAEAVIRFFKIDEKTVANSVKSYVAGNSWQQLYKVLTGEL